MLTLISKPRLGRKRRELSVAGPQMFRCRSVAGSHLGNGADS